MTKVNTLELVNIYKSFNIDSIKNVSLKFKSGEIHAVIGENAAGKSTLIKLLSGVMMPDSGMILYNGQPIKNHNIAKAHKLKIGTLFQTSTLFEEMSVLENIFIKNYPGLRFARHILNQDKMLHIYRELMASIGFSLDSRVLLKYLTPSQKRIVEIAKVLYGDPDILLLDEPTASFSDIELLAFYKLLKKLKQSGKLIVYITHNIKEAIDISDLITVMHNGRISYTFSSSTANEATLLKSIAGKEFLYRYPRTFVKKRRSVVRVCNLTNANLHDISFTAYEGEILGITGLVDSGKSHIGMALFGLESFDSGQVTLNGLTAPKKMRPNTAIAAKLGYISGETANTYIPEFTPELNITLSNMKKITPMYFINKDIEYVTTNEFFRRLGIPGIYSNQKMKYLSGGIQQKINISKALFSNAKILIMDEPTKGIDSASKSDVYNLMNNYTLHMNTIILISSDFEEIAGMCDRVLIMQKGEIIKEIFKKNLNKNDIVFYSIKQ
jgi:ribose transport system ATP-binding protein